LFISTSSAKGGGKKRGERNIAIINIVALAHALRVEPARLLETLS